MQVTRRLEERNGRIALFVQVGFDDAELAIVDGFDLWDYRIKTSEGPFVGKDALSANLKAAFRVQLGRVKNRWSASLVRTSSFTLLDVLLFVFSLLFKTVRGLLKLVFGRRRRLSHLLKGIEITSSRIETIKEAEFFIFVSLAAVHKAMEYGATVGTQTLYSDAEFLTLVEGLDFAGAGGLLESDFDPVTDVASAYSKVG